ncbi:MAG: aminoacyl-tRNA hydrolase [Eubacteriaceae bacterium]|jgi:PTH1 family peptidyl-tRNA hydrolase|nr:aminoacyl-tRNA hydrolase [Eubacteriaceae bacterium]
MYLIVGLGNPGRKYAQTRHNMGFITIDYMADKLGVQVNKLKHRAKVGESSLSGHKVMFAKPQTFMNLSGESVGEIVRFYKIQPDHVIVIYDDMDIAAGSIRIRKKGSAGSHNGMKSVIMHMGTDEFPRIRIGIGAHEGVDAVDYVIGGFSKEDKEPLERAVMTAAKAVETIISDGIDKAMNMYNGNC